MLNSLPSSVAVLYQVLNKQVPVPVPVVQVPVQVPVSNLQVPVPVPVRNLQVPVPVQVLCINYRHSVILQLHKLKVVVSFIFKKRTVRINELQTQSVVKSVTTVFFLYFGWLVATHAASQQHKENFLLGNKYFVTSTSTSTSTKDSSTSTSTSTLHASTSTSTSTRKMYLSTT